LHGPRQTALCDALKARKKQGEPPAQALKFFDQLYRIERQARDEIPDEGETQASYMRRFRQKHSVPVLDALKAWLDDIAPKVVPDTKLGDAVSRGGRVGLHRDWQRLSGLPAGLRELPILGVM
jgi:hypothetical protein